MVLTPSIHEETFYSRTDHFRALEALIGFEAEINNGIVRGLRGTITDVRENPDHDLEIHCGSATIQLDASAYKLREIGGIVTVIGFGKDYAKTFDITSYLSAA